MINFSGRKEHFSKRRFINNNNNDNNNYNNTDNNNTNILGNFFFDLIGNYRNKIWLENIFSKSARKIFILGTLKKVQRFKQKKEI